MKLAENNTNKATIESSGNVGLNGVPDSKVGKKSGLRALDPEVAVKRTCRRFSAKYKLRILEQADECASASERGALLRREGLYSGYLLKWRRLYEQGALTNLQPKKRGVKAKILNPQEQKISALEKEKAKLQKEIKKAHALLELQKKVSDIMGLSITIAQNNEGN